MRTAVSVGCPVADQKKTLSCCVCDSLKAERFFLLQAYYRVSYKSRRFYILCSSAVTHWFTRFAHGPRPGSLRSKIKVKKERASPLSKCLALNLHYRSWASESSFSQRFAARKRQHCRNIYSECSLCCVSDPKRPPQSWSQGEGSLPSARTVRLRNHRYQGHTWLRYPIYIA